MKRIEGNITWLNTTQHNTPSIIKTNKEYYKKM